jgi:acyl-CoA synthetase (AMP-forming)/AMP-acid ligase II
VVVGFAEMLATATRLAGSFAAIATPGERVALLADNALAWIECMYAVPMAGQVLVPLNYRLSPAELADQLALCGASLLVCDRARYERMQPELARARSVRAVILLGSPEWERLRAGEDVAPLPAPQPGDVAWLIFTSGTSGRPKGTLLTHRSLATAIVANSLGRPINRDDVYISAYPLCHVSAMNVPLYHAHGCAVILLRRFEARLFASAAQRNGATTTTLAPTMLAALLDHLETTGQTLPTLRRIGYGAAPMPAALLARGRRVLDVTFTESYGMTELSGAVVFDGVPSPLAVVRVVDDRGQPVPAGETGEIVVLSEQVAAGYWDDPELTALTFRDGWLHTGDLGRFDPDGLLQIIGRLKDIIISGGENVMAREVEEILMRHPSVVEAAVVGVPDEYWGEAICAFVVTSPEGSLSRDDLDGHVRQTLASFKRPRVVHFVTELPVGGSGKIAKDQLRRRAAEFAAQESRS